MKFLALDFETANDYRNSACAIGLVLVENLKIISKAYHLIQPPQKWFKFTYIHGITWDQVKDEPAFDTVWKRIKPFWKGIDFATAHNASFDSSVLSACCQHYGIIKPEINFRCTMWASRKMWNIHPTDLSNVCKHFKIELNHHEALSDATACAKIMINAIKDGYAI
jgi:DNA polymerase-3 subunit epsilon